MVFVIALAVMKFDYGPMKLHEANALKGDSNFIAAVKNLTGSEEKYITEEIIETT